MTIESHDPLHLPALRATMGDWNYYITFMRMEHIPGRIRTAEDIHTSKTLNELLQRQLTNNSRKIAEYLRNQPQRFFNAIVVGAYGGNPEWRDVQLKERPGITRSLPEDLQGSIGVLTLSGEELLFAIDGQHRVVGIGEAIAADKGLRDDEVCVIFVKGVSAKRRVQDPSGFERTRRLFTTLNRYAKPVGKRDVIALDEDDGVAITTRRLVEEYSPFDGRISVAKTKNIPRSDKVSFTTIVALYDVLDIILRKPDVQWKEYKRWRPADSDLERSHKTSVRFWNGVCRNFPAVGVLKERASDEPISDFRNTDGGNLLYRPIGILMLAKAVRAFEDAGETQSVALTKLARVPMELSSDLWSGLLWDASNRRMITRSENQTVAWRVLFYTAGGELSQVNTTKTKLTEELAGLLNRPVEEVRLRRARQSQ